MGHEFWYPTLYGDSVLFQDLSLIETGTFTTKFDEQYIHHPHTYRKSPFSDGHYRGAPEHRFTLILNSDKRDSYYPNSYLQFSDVPEQVRIERVTVDYRLLGLLY